MYHMVNTTGSIYHIVDTIGSTHISRFTTGSIYHVVDVHVAFITLLILHIAYITLLILQVVYIILLTLQVVYIMLFIQQAEYLPEVNIMLLIYFASSSVWNSIPNDVRCAPSLSSFKSCLKTYLFRSVYID